MRRALLLFLLSFFSFFSVHGQCDPSMDSLYFESFEGGISENWQLIEGSDGANWEVSEQGFASFSNPGSGKWLFIDDQVEDKVGEAQFLSPEFNLSGPAKPLELSFDLNFQSFDRLGKFQVEIFTGITWVVIFEVKDDLKAKVRIDLSELVVDRHRFRFTYDDGESWAWGVGIDNFLISAPKNNCGNGICETGESPDSCPGDCESSDFLPFSWVAYGKDMNGESAVYKSFAGNASCDDCSEEISLSFPFGFYGETFESVFFNSNGNLSFSEDYIDYVPQSFCLKGPKMIAPFFSDVDLSKGGELSYYVDPEGSHAIFNWKEVAYFGCKDNCEKRNTFQLILLNEGIRKFKGKVLPGNTNVIMNYAEMSWTGGEASGSNHGLGGSPATVGLNGGNGEWCNSYGEFGDKGYTFYGKNQASSCEPNGIDHLDYRALFFNSDEGEYADYKGITDFQGKSTDEGVSLTWWVDLIREEGYFEIERAIDSGDFEIIGIRPISETDISESVLNFIFEDPEKVEGQLEYRINYLGNDEILYKDSLGLKINSTNLVFETQGLNARLDSYGPNPFLHEISIELFCEKEQDMRFELLDMSGRSLKSGIWKLNQGSNSKSIRTADFAAGMYNLLLWDFGGKRNIRLLKK